MKNNKIAMTINFKNSVIRFYKETIKSLGNPTHILLYLDYKKQYFIVTPGLKDNVLAHNISRYLNKKNVVIFSKAFLQELQRLNPNILQDKVYRFDGEYNKDEKTIKFNINKGIEIIK